MNLSLQRMTTMTVAAAVVALCASPFVRAVYADSNDAAVRAIEQDLVALQAKEVRVPGHAEKLLSDLVALDSERNAAELALQVLRRAAHLAEPQSESEPSSEEVAQLMSDLKAVSSPDFQIWDEDFVYAQAADAAAEGEAPMEAEEDAEEPVEAEPMTEPGAAEGDEAPMVEEDLPPPPAPREDVSPEQIQNANTALSTARTELEGGIDSSTDSMLGEEPKTAPAPKEYKGDPLRRPVNLHLREMELANVVALLAHMADINVIAISDVQGTVTADLRGVPLMQAMKTALRLNDLGIIEEEGIYQIVPYSEAIAKERVTEMITLENAKAENLQTVLEDLLAGTPDAQQVNISANEEANILLISGPEERIIDLVMVASQLDVAEPKLPTVTEAIKLNYSTPNDVLGTVERILTPELGQVAADERSRHLIVTDQPVVVEQVRTLLETLDMPVKEVMIDTMVVDVTLTDDADTGVDWLLDVVRSQSRRNEALGNDVAIGNLQELGLGTNLDSGVTGTLLNFGVLSQRFDWRGAIQAEIRSLNGKFVSNPVVFTVENKTATIEIVTEIPFRELTETAAGGSQTSTEFKDVGTVLEVTPRVTHDNHIIAEVSAKESSTSGEFAGIPIEDRRSIDTTMRLADGETIFMGGLRKRIDNTNVRKVPLLGDVPVINLLFRNTSQSEQTTELLVFMTCKVVEKQTFSDQQQMVLDDTRNLDMNVDAMQDVWRTSIHPKAMHDPMWKFRRAE